jgi:hypothetical protein
VGGLASGKAVTAGPPGSTVVVMKELSAVPCPILASQEDRIGPATCPGLLQVAPPSAEETNRTLIRQLPGAQRGS